MERRRTQKNRIFPRIRRGGERPCLTVHEGSDLGREYFLGEGETLIGRDPGAAVSLTDPSVSRRHALVRIPREPEDPCEVEDLGSTNGSWLNGRALAKAPLHDGDRLQVGDTVLCFEWKNPSSSRYTRKLYRAATRDPLTDAVNRDHLALRLEEAMLLRTESGWPVSLLLGDLDRFKSVNDTWGHAAGDAVLRATARAMMDAVRRPDVVARYGGEEFAVILAGGGLEEAVQTAERVREAIEDLRIPVGEAVLRVTISIGVASSPPLEIAAPDDLLRAADRALYQAKNSGRNRCCVYRPGE